MKLFCFLGATKHLFNWLCPSVGWSVGLSVTHSFDDPHVAPDWPTWPCYKNVIFFLEPSKEIEIVTGKIITTFLIFELFQGFMFL